MIETPFGPSSTGMGLRHACIVAVATAIAACTGGTPPASTSSEEAELRTGFTLACPAVAKVSRDPEVIARGGHTLLSEAASELPRTPTLPAYAELMGRGGDAVAEIRSKVEELGLTTECAALLAAFEASAEHDRLAATAAEAEYRGRSFRFETPTTVRPWREGASAQAWERGGVAFTEVFRSAVTHARFMSVVPIDAMPSECTTAATDYARDHSLELVDSRTRPATGARAGAPLQSDCTFLARAPEPHRQVVGMFVALEFATLLLTCEGDERVGGTLLDCDKDIREGLRPPAAEDARVPPEGLDLSFPRWR